MDSVNIWEIVIKSVILLLAMTVGFAYLTLYERRMLAWMQTRVGPNRAGPWGLLQPAADGIKLIFKEELIPARADKWLFILAPVITVVPALIITATIPWGGAFEIGGTRVTLYLADVNVGALYIMTVAAISVYGIALAGWASNNKYAILGGLRFCAQLISYEIAQGLCFVVAILLAGSMRVIDIVDAQKNVWFIFLQPGAALIFFMTMLAEINRAPFDMAEAEQELTGGFNSEYSGMKFALFYMAEYIKMIAVSMIFSTLFLGGYHFPFLDQIPWLAPLVLFAKVVVVLFLIIWVRATLPRIRYDRLMALGWKVLFPAALLCVLLTAAVVLMVGG